MARNVISSTVFVIVFFLITLGVCTCVCICDCEQAHVSCVLPPVIPACCDPSDPVSLAPFQMAYCPVLSAGTTSLNNDSARALFFCSHDSYLLYLIFHVWSYSGQSLNVYEMFVSSCCCRHIQSFKEIFSLFFNFSFLKLLRIKIWNIQTGDEQYRGGTITTNSFQRALNLCVLKYHYSAAFKACQLP